MRSAQSGTSGGSSDPPDADASLATALPVAFGVVLIALALSESFDALLGAVVAFAATHLVLRGD